MLFCVSLISHIESQLQSTLREISRSCTFKRYARIYLTGSFMQLIALFFSLFSCDAEIDFQQIQQDFPQPWAIL